MGDPGGLLGGGSIQWKGPEKTLDRGNSRIPDSKARASLVAGGKEQRSVAPLQSEHGAGSGKRGNRGGQAQTRDATFWGAKRCLGGMECAWRVLDKRWFAFWKMTLANFSEWIIQARMGQRDPNPRAQGPSLETAKHLGSWVPREGHGTGSLGLCPGF